MRTNKFLGKIQDRIDKKAAYFHLVAWSLPLILTITTMAFGEVDGNSVTGVCFVGYVNHPMRAALLLAPLSIVLLLGGYFLLRGKFNRNIFLVCMFYMYVVKNMI